MFVRGLACFGVRFRAFCLCLVCGASPKTLSGLKQKTSSGGFMDPNLFHLDWERVGEVLTTVIVLSFILERALAVLFESRQFIKRFEGKGVKEWIAATVCVAVCVIWKFDAISMIILTDKTTIFGEILTGCVIAGGSKASMKLF